MRAASIILGAMLATTVAAQTVHVVGPGGFAQISTAIAVARAGDTILVTARGPFDSFVLDRALTIRAAAGVRAGVWSDRTVVFRIPGAGVAEVVGLDFLATFYARQARVRVESGTVSFRRCSSTSASFCTDGPALEVRQAQVVLQQCTLIGGGAAASGLLAVDSNVSAAESLFQGGIGCYDAFPPEPGDGIELRNSRFHGSRIVARGGDAGLVFGLPISAGHGIVVGAGSRMSLAHAIVSGGLRGRAPRDGDGIVNLDPIVPVDVVRLTATAGGPTGSGIVGRLRTVPALLETWTTTAHLVPGSSYTVRFHGPPNTMLAVLGNLRLERLDMPPLARPLWLATQPSPLLFAVAVTDALGTAVVSPAIPNVPSAAGSLWLQAVSVAGPTIELSPVVGGQVF